MATFLAGNDDVGSIGCNLLPHPGMAVFRSVFAELGARPDVHAIHAQIAEVDPGEGCWPFADTVYVVGPIPAPELTRALAPLQPDEIDLVPPSELPAPLHGHAPAPVHRAWWD